MKTLYTSPVITVEELTKVDVLCSSTELNYEAKVKSDDVNQAYKTLVDFSNFM